MWAHSGQGVRHATPTKRASELLAAFDGVGQLEYFNAAVHLILARVGVCLAPTTNLSLLRCNEPARPHLLNALPEATQSLLLEKTRAARELYAAYTAGTPQNAVGPPERIYNELSRLCPVSSREPFALFRRTVRCT